MTSKPSAADRLDALEQELAREREQRKQLEQQLKNTVATFPQGVEVKPVAQVVDDRTKVVGLRPGLVPFWPAKAEQYPKHPHTEAYAIQIGYRAATPADFEEVDGVSPQKRFEMVTSRMPSHALFVTSQEHANQRTRSHEARSAAAANAKMPTFHNPDGEDVTVRRT